MLRSINPLLHNLAPSSSSAILYSSLIHKSSVSFGRIKGLNKHERSFTADYEFFEKMEAREKIQRDKKLRRKGLDPDSEPSKPFITDEMFNRYLNNPELLSADNVVFDEETGIMAKKEVIADINNFVKSSEYTELEEFMKKDSEEIKKKPKAPSVKKLEKKEKNKLPEIEAAEGEGTSEKLPKSKEEILLEDLDDIGGGGRKVKRISELPQEEYNPKKEQNYERALKQFSLKTTPEAQIKHSEEIEERSEEEEEYVPKPNYERDSFKKRQLPRDEEEEYISKPNKDKDSFKKRRDNEEEDFSIKSRRPSNVKDRDFENILNEFSSSSLRSKNQQNSLSDQDEEDLFEESEAKPARGGFNKKQQYESPSQSHIGLDKGKLGAFFTEISPEKQEQIERIQETREKKKYQMDSDSKRVANMVYSHKKEKNEPMIKEYDTFVKSLEKKKSLEKFYFFLRKVEPDNLIKLLSQNSLIENDPVENIPKFLILLNFVRKNKILNNYNREDIYHVIESILKNLHHLRYTEVSALAVLLERMRIDKVDYFREIEKRVIEDAPNMSIRAISNIIFSFGRISTKQSIIEDFSELFGKMENVIALKVNNMKPKDLCQIMVGYSKSQNFSPEFLYVLEQACLANFKMMNSQEMAVIAHSFAKNDYPSSEFFKLLRKNIFPSILY